MIYFKAQIKSNGRSQTRSRREAKSQNVGDKKSILIGLSFMGPYKQTLTETLLKGARKSQLRKTKLQEN